jgi:hypothetical protein
VVDPEQLTTEETRRAEREESTEARADRPPTAEEERLADGNDLDPEVAEHAREMYELGASVEGEGRID